MNLHILRERARPRSPHRCPSRAREHQERQPGKQQRNEEDALAHQQQRIVGQVRPAQKLEERPAQDERKVRLIPVQKYRGWWWGGFMSSSSSLLPGLLPAHLLPHQPIEHESTVDLQGGLASKRPKMSRVGATKPVHPVRWLAPSPAPLSPWKYS